MREVKFRAWDFENNVMIQSDALAFEEYAPLVDLLNQKGIMQFTGLRDRNGTEIYEGDICLEIYFSNSNPLDRSDDDYFDESPKKMIICYDSNQGKYKAVPVETYLINAGNGGWTGYEVRRFKFEVIGNIYDNPELLSIEKGETS